MMKMTFDSPKMHLSGNTESSLVPLADESIKRLRAELEKTESSGVIDSSFNSLFNLEVSCLEECIRKEEQMQELACKHFLASIDSRPACDSVALRMQADECSAGSLHLRSVIKEIRQQLVQVSRDADRALGTTGAAERLGQLALVASYAAT